MSTESFLTTIVEARRDILDCHNKLIDMNNLLEQKSPGALSKASMLKDLIEWNKAKVDLAEAEMKLSLATNQKG